MNFFYLPFSRAKAVMRHNASAKIVVELICQGDGVTFDNNIQIEAGKIEEQVTDKATDNIHREV